MGNTLIISFILITIIFNLYLGSAQSDSSITVLDELVSGTSLSSFDMGELSLHEHFSINITSSLLLPWQLMVYKLSSNGMRTDVESKKCGGSLISWNPGTQKYINVNVSGYAKGPGHYFLEISMQETVLRPSGVPIDIGSFVPTEWHLLVKKYSDKEQKSDSEQSPFENVSENTTARLQQTTENGMVKVLPLQPIDSESEQSPFENVSENTTARLQQPTENGMVKVLPLQPIDSESEQSPFENVSEDTIGRSQTPSENLTENATRVKPSGNFTENGTRIVLPLSRRSISVYRSVRLESPSENLTENATKVKPNENFTENGTKVEPVEVIDLANELL